MGNYICLDLGATKVYLISCIGGYMLIDTGYKTAYENFTTKLEEVGVTIDEIKYLLLTHYHDDHSGFASKLKKEFGIPLIVQEKSIPLLASGEMKEDEGKYITRRVHAIFLIFKLFHKEFVFPPVIVDDNDTIVCGDDSQVLRNIGIDADILYTPGHSVDHMCVLCDDGTAFVGDAAMNSLNFAGARYRPIYYNDLEQTYNSIKKIIASGAKTIMPAHGEPFDVKELQDMLAHFNV